MKKGSSSASYLWSYYYLQKYRTGKQPMRDGGRVLTLSVCLSVHAAQRTNDGETTNLSRKTVYLPLEPIKLKKTQLFICCWPC